MRSLSASKPVLKGKAPHKKTATKIENLKMYPVISISTKKPFNNVEMQTKNFKNRLPLVWL